MKIIILYTIYTSCRHFLKNCGQWYIHFIYGVCKECEHYWREIITILNDRIYT